MEESEKRIQAIAQKSNDSDIRLAHAYVSLFAGNKSQARELAEGELPHPDAQLIMDALDAGTDPNRLFAINSSWWLPPELQ